MAAGLGVSGALAQPATEGRTAVVQRLADCRKVSGDAERLACYDAAAAALDQAEASGEVVVVDREQAQKLRRQAFGFALPSLSLFDRREGGGEGAGRPQSMDRITASIQRAYQRGDGKWVLELEEGAVWLQTDLEPLSRGPKKGSVVEIRRAAMGSFFANVDGQRALRVRRVE